MLGDVDTWRPHSHYLMRQYDGVSRWAGENAAEVQAVKVQVQINDLVKEESVVTNLFIFHSPLALLTPLLPYPAPTSAWSFSSYPLQLTLSLAQNCGLLGSCHLGLLLSLNCTGCVELSSAAK